MKGIFSGKQLKALKTKGLKATRSQTAAQAIKAIAAKYGTVKDSAKYYHKSNGVWQKYSIENDSKRTGKLASSKAQWRQQPHKLDYSGIDTKKTTATKTKNPKRQFDKLAHAKGVLAAVYLGGVQVVGAKNISNARKELERAGQIKGAYTLAKLTENNIKQFYAQRNPVIGDLFSDTKGQCEITKIERGKTYNNKTNKFEQNSTMVLTYNVVGTKKGRTGTIYIENKYNRRALSVTSLKAPVKLTGRKGKTQVGKSHKAVTKSIPKRYKAQIEKTYRYAMYNKPIPAGFNPGVEFRTATVTAKDKLSGFRERPVAVIVTEKPLSKDSLMRLGLLDLRVEKRKRALVDYVSKQSTGLESVRHNIVSNIYNGRITKRSEIDTIIGKQNRNVKNSFPLGVTDPEKAKRIMDKRALYQVGKVGIASWTSDYHTYHAKAEIVKVSAKTIGVKLLQNTSTAYDPIKDIMRKGSVKQYKVGDKVVVKRAGGWEPIDSQKSIKFSLSALKSPAGKLSKRVKKTSPKTSHKAITKSAPKKSGVQKSKGHLMFIGDFEIYKKLASGDVFASRKNNYIDTFGYRADSRFLGTKEFWAEPKNRNSVLEGFRPEGYAKKAVTGMKRRYASFQRPLGSWFKPNVQFELVDVKASDRDFRWKDRKPHSVIVTSQKLPDYTVKQLELVDLAEGRKLEALVKQVNKTGLTDNMKGQLENMVLSGRVKTRADINKYVEKGRKVMGKKEEAKSSSPYSSLKFKIRRATLAPKPKKPTGRKGGKALKMGDKFTYRPSKIQSLNLTQAQKEIIAARKAARTPAKKVRAKKVKLAPREATEAKIRELEAEHNKLSNDVDKYTGTYNSYLKHIADTRQEKRDTGALEANAKAVMDHVKKLREGITDVQEKVRLQKIKLNDIDAKEKKARIIDEARNDWNNQAKMFMSGNVPFRDRNAKECYNRHARGAGI